MARNEKEGRPDIKLLLKELDPASLADPGDHLRKVIEFKNKVFAERKLLAGTFTDLRDFEAKLRRCIQGYVISLTKKDQAATSEKEQAPLGETQATPPSEPGPTTPLSVEGARFLREFVGVAENATDEKPLVSDEVARFRLLSIIAAVPGNDQESLGSHDANLLFKVRSKFNFGRRELVGLLDSGLDHFKHENVPLWYWLAAIDGFKESILPIFSMYGPTERRIGTLKAMCLIAEPIIEEKYFGRNEIISTWFSEETPSALKVAALEYLGQWGKKSDIPHINQEFAKNETQTTNPAAEAIVRINMRDDRRVALESLYQLQPSIVNKDLLDELFSRDTEFDDEMLIRGIGHQSSDIRSTVVKLLHKRHMLTPSIAEPLLNDSDVEVRYEAMQALIASGRSYSLDQAKAALLRKRPNSIEFGVFGLSQNDMDGEAALESYREEFFDNLTTLQLEEESRSEILNQDAYFSLIRRNFKLHGNDLRKVVANQFSDRFEALLEEMGKRYVNHVELIEKTRAIGKGLRREFTRKGLEIICNKLNPIDLPLVRSLLTEGDLDYSSADLTYLAKFGEWCDIPLVINTLKRPAHGRKYASILSITSGTRYADAARALYSIGKHRLEDLLTMTMPTLLLVRLIPLIPDKVFRDLSNVLIVQLLRSETEDVRKVTSLKCLRTFSQRRVKQFLEDYILGDQFYYNVIYWFDFGISVPRDRMLRAVSKALAEA